MNDPSNGLPGQMLPHMHLVSALRYPIMNTIPADTIIECLISAPKVVREQPMYWTFLDGPQDGTTILTWQPLNHLGSNFASDGYVWVDPEQAYTFEAKGHIVEMWVHQSGYHPPNEAVATHCRKRYRFLPPKVPSPNLAPPDPSLWIVHYSRASQTIPANRIAITPQIQSVLAQRRFLQSHGPPVRTDFMLHDRNNWPTISFPPHMGQQGLVQPPGMYSNPMISRQQGSFYTPQQNHSILGTVTSQSSKAPRGHRGSAGVMAATVADFSLEDEEVSAGDMLDMLSPREISKMRYQQHHEWMEEVFGSPYTTKQIIPVDLGLGRKGELELLTADFFDAPVGVTSSKESKDNTLALQGGKIDQQKAEEFAERVTQKIAHVTAEIEKLRKQYARRKEKLGQISIVAEAELRLREAITDPSETGSEVWRLEGRIEAPTEEGVSPVDYVVQTPRFKVDDVIKEVEIAYGRTIVPEPNVSCVQKGGLLERIDFDQTPDTSGNELDSAENDVLMDNPDSHLLDQFGTPPSSTLGQIVAATARAPAPHISAATPARSSHAFNATTVMGARSRAGPYNSTSNAGVMGVSHEQNQINSDGETGDWVMVGNEDKTLRGQNAIEGDKTSSRSGIGPAALSTPGSGMQGLTSAGTENTGDAGGLEASNFEDAADFTNIDSAGDALAAYSDGLDLPDLENSAFGDAFHASDNEVSHHPDADEMS